MINFIKKILISLRARLGANFIFLKAGSCLTWIYKIALGMIGCVLLFIDEYHTPIDGFTHYARFYGVPCYCNVETQEVAGRTWLSEHFLQLATVFHNEIVERATQFLAFKFYIDYEPGFPLRVWEIEP